MQRRWWLIAGILGLAVLTFLLWPRPYCKPARDAYGIIVPICPDGRLHQELQIRGSRLRRGAKGSVTIYARALYTVSTSDTYRSAFIPEVSAKLSLVDAQGKETKLKAEPSVLKPRKPWRHGSIGEITTDVTLPTKLDDGNYKLRARVKTKVAEGVVDLPLPLYAPARIHVLTDRPLYEAGHRIQFRALAVRARDLSPLDHRPGTWVVKDPAGTTVLEERAPAGPWGVVSGDFLLDAEAKTGRWTITWRSGATEGHTSVKVEPFTLPRFRVSATPGKTFYQRNQIPHVAGAVIYSSGAPVQGAKVNLTWSAQGAWPPPSDWLKKTLPRHATTDATGHFALTLPKIPADLQGQVTLNARIAAIDPAGDRVAGSVNVLLSQDAIRVSAFTPLSRGGLVRGANNRLYLRVTTADGRPLSGAKIVVRKAWRQKGEGITTDLDENSVGRVQLDPGAPVNIVIPARPVRASQSSDHSVNRTRAYDLVARQNARLADLVEMDRWLALVRPCAKCVSSGDRAAKVALAFNRAGAFVSSAATTPLARCVVARLHGRRLPKGQDRLYAMTFAFATPRNLPRLTYRATRALDDDDALEDGLSSLFDLATRDARDCLPKHRSGHLPRVLSWRLHAKAKKPSLTWLTGPNTRSRSVPASAERCIMNRLKKRSLPEPATKDAFGLVHFTLSRAPGPRHRRRSRPTIMRGYELLVSASRGKERLGHTKLRMRPGKVQRLLLRADPVLAKAGETITLRLLRGPRFRGSLPRWFKVTHLGETKTIKLPKKAKAGTYRYALPAQAKGWYTFSTQGRRALVFVKSTQNLTVAVKPEKP
ncbi:MAG: hypothetical protein KAI47_09175, partial [Deltaproteobacteria bacterium]|nr:hypothetical protein [Deltaproteobacteria bacterium]